MTVLIADDHDTNRKLVRVIMKSQGYDTVEARDGEEALACLQKVTQPTLALIDWAMPLIDGAEVCRRIRKQVNLPRLYLILLTVRDSKQDIALGLDAGADDYITKPFNHPELVERVKAGVQKIGV